MSPRSARRSPSTTTTESDATRFVAALLFIVIALPIACTQTDRYVHYGQLGIRGSKI